MKNSRTIAALGLAGLVGLTSCVPGGVHPNGPAISNFTAQTMLVKAQEPDRTNQTVNIPQLSGQQPYNSSTYTILTDFATGKQTTYPGNIKNEAWVHDTQRFPRGIQMLVYYSGDPEPGRYLWYPPSQ